MSHVTEDVSSLRCDCGSEEICLTYTAPVFVCLRSEEVMRVVVEEEVTFGRVARCLACDRFWVVDDGPEMGMWPAWEFGW